MATGVVLAHQQEMAEVEYKRIIETADKQLAETRFLMGSAAFAVEAVILGGLRAHTLADPATCRMVETFPRVEELGLAELYM